MYHYTLFDGLNASSSSTLVEFSLYRYFAIQYKARYMYAQVLLREEETKMALNDADIKAVELDAQKALLEQVGS